MPNRHLSTEDLISRLQQLLPFSAFVTKHALAALASQGKPPIRNKQRIEIDKVLDGGDDGGIMCAAPIKGGKEALFISITQLRFDMNHPLHKEVRAYQIDRTKRLAVERLHQTGQWG